MNRNEIIDLLSTAAVYDRRTAGEADVQGWVLAIGDLDFADAQAAVVAHYREQTDWLMPAHVRTRVKRMREIRLAARPILEPPADLTDNPPVYRAELQSEIKRLADGMGLQRALPAPGHGAAPPPEYDKARGVYRDPLRLAALKVACPWPNCWAPVSVGCRTRGGTVIEGHGHDARLVVAGLADWVEKDGVRRVLLRGQEDNS